MVAETFHLTGRLNDRQIIKMMKAIEETFGSENLAYRFGQIRLDADELDSLIGSKKTFTIDAVDLTTERHKFVVRYRRGTTLRGVNGQALIDQRSPSPYLDEVIVTPNHGQFTNGAIPDVSDIHNLTQILDAHLILKALNNSDDGKAGSAVNVLQAELADLSSLHTKMIEQASAERAAFAEERQRISQEAIEEFQTKREENKTYLEGEEARLKAIEDKIKEREKELDDRDHMHVRRQLRESITNEIRDRVAGALLPKGTSRLNIAICAGSFLIACVAGYFAISSFTSFDGLIAATAEQTAENANSNFQTWLIAEFLRGSLSSFACIGFLVYTVSWLRRTYLANVKVAQDLQKYSLDINRASWTIETIMEMTTKEGRVLPDRWIDGVCHGLFQTSEQDHAEITPMEAWTALLSGAAKVQHGPDGTTLELSGKDASKMAKSKKV